MDKTFDHRLMKKLNVTKQFLSDLKSSLSLIKIKFFK